MATRQFAAWLFSRRNSTFAEIRIPIDRLDTAIIEYVDSLDTGETSEYCPCHWRIHPDDVNKPKGERRSRRVQEHPRCPVHTKEGFLCGFIEYLSKHG